VLFEGEFSKKAQQETNYQQFLDTQRPFQNGILENILYGSFQKIAHMAHND
jgi:hypothetical protein